LNLRFSVIAALCGNDGSIRVIKHYFFTASLTLAVYYIYHRAPFENLKNINHLQQEVVKEAKTNPEGVDVSQRLLDNQLLVTFWLFEHIDEVITEKN
jgi:hypothetical protein